MRAVCQRCGGRRDRYDQICPHCGHRPHGDGLLVAWLLSTEHLSPEQLDAAAERIARGDAPRPSDRQLERARVALGRHFRSDPGLTVGQRLGWLAMSALLTPLPGWVAWWWWRRTRPRAAVQVLALSLPFTLIYFVLWPAVGLFG